MDIDALNAEFGDPGAILFTEGPGGLVMIEVANRLATATVTLHGGQVLSYRPRGSDADLLFVSERAYFEPGREIKGGIPICWPWFGTDPEHIEHGIHGFVRLHSWTLSACDALPDGSTRILLGIGDDATTRATWGHPFDLTLEIRVGATLSLALTTRNPGPLPYSITQGLHAYFTVGDARRTLVEGLEGCRYIDKAAGAGDAVVTQRGPIGVAAEVNRIYQGAPARLSISDPVLGRRIRIDTCNSATCVVWNPWVERARAMPDLDDADYRRFICVETVNTAAEVIEIPPQGAYRLAADYHIEALP